MEISSEKSSSKQKTWIIPNKQASQKISMKDFANFLKKLNKKKLKTAQRL